MGEFHNKILRNVLLSVSQLPAPSFFKDKRFYVFHCIISALNVPCFYNFMIVSVVSQHPPCVSSRISCACVFTALFIICVQRIVQRRSVVQWKNIRVQCMIKPLFGRRGATNKTMKLCNHNTLQTLLIVWKVSKGVYRNKCWMLD
jgi:hypothetical protein